MGLHKNLAANGLDITVGEAVKFMDKYLYHYNEIYKWQKSFRNIVAISSLGGRYHSLKDEKTTSAINWSIQATGADILKESLIMLYRQKDYFDFKIVSAIHDSITIETPYENKDIAIKCLKKSMLESFGNFIKNVNIDVDIDVKEAE